MGKIHLYKYSERDPLLIILMILKQGYDHVFFVLLHYVLCWSCTRLLFCTLVHLVHLNSTLHAVHCFVVVLLILWSDAVVYDLKTDTRSISTRGTFATWSLHDVGMRILLPFNFV